MDQLIAVTARALAAGDPLGALNRVALRNDKPALVLHGTARLPRADDHEIGWDTMAHEFGGLPSGLTMSSRSILSKQFSRINARSSYSAAVLLLSRTVAVDARPGTEAPAF